MKNRRRKLIPPRNYYALRFESWRKFAPSSPTHLHYLPPYLINLHLPYALTYTYACLNADLADFLIISFLAEVRPRRISGPKKSARFSKVHSLTSLLSLVSLFLYVILYAILYVLLYAFLYIILYAILYVILYAFL